MKRIRTAILSVFLLALVSGCASQNQWLYPPMAIPLQVSAKKEVQIAQLTQLIQRRNLDDKVRAKMLYERGSFYDSVGLRLLARLDFDQSLALDPAQSDVYNLLGVNFTEEQQFDDAYEAFDSAIELDPKNLFAIRNRAIALYYGGRYELALEDLQTLTKDGEADPFISLWRYIIQYEIDPVLAKKTLTESYASKRPGWGWFLVGVMLNKVTNEQALKAIVTTSADNVVLAERLTETYFYIAKRYQLMGDLKSAYTLYKIVLSSNVYDYIEHKYAYIELDRIKKEAAQLQQHEADEEKVN